MDLGLKNKVAVISAASQGLGKASALALAAEGARLVICSRSKERIEAAAHDIEVSTGARVVPVVADVARPEDVETFVATAKKQFGTVHVLVNNAGGPPVGDILSMPDDEWRRGFELTLMSMVRLTRSVLPMMIAQKWGRVITLTSLTAKQPINELLLSSTYRPGISGLTKVLSGLYAQHNVTVNSVLPGHTATARQVDLAKSRGEKMGLSAEQYFASVAKDIPAGRLARPEEIGNVVAFLASEKASYINGVNLLVDGGFVKGIN